MRWAYYFWGCMLVVCLRFALHAQDTTDRSPADTVSANATKAAEFAAAEAKRYEMRYADRSGDVLELVAEPVLRWSNPTSGEVHGSVVLWTSDGCPEAAASIYEMFTLKQINIELVSLSEFPLKANRNGRVRWAPEAGVKFVPLPDGPAAAASAGRRQLQMRSLARRFTGALADRGDDVTLSELRLMNRPLHSYESSDGTRDGAVFALVNTTDPEILLIIESRKADSGREWVYAAARMHYCRLQMKLGDKVVWEVPQAAPPWDEIRGPKGQYVILEWHSEEEAAKD